jgi:hypothetical protein
VDGTLLHTSTDTGIAESAAGNSWGLFMKLRFHDWPTGQLQSRHGLP